MIANTLSAETVLSLQMDATSRCSMGESPDVLSVTIAESKAFLSAIIFPGPSNSGKQGGFIRGEVLTRTHRYYA
jgi:hypothetical protein